jgi:hypothetical protein
MGQPPFNRGVLAPTTYALRSRHEQPSPFVKFLEPHPDLAVARERDLAEAVLDHGLKHRIGDQSGDVDVRVRAEDVAELLRLDQSRHAHDRIARPVVPVPRDQPNVERQPESNTRAELYLLSVFPEACLQPADEDIDNSGWA